MEPTDLILYRYHDIPVCDGSLRLACDEYVVVKETAHVCYINPIWDSAGASPRKIYKHARKLFASPSKETAFVSFQARKLRQISIYEARLKQAKKALTLRP